MFGRFENRSEIKMNCYLCLCTLDMTSGNEMVKMSVIHVLQLQGISELNFILLLFLNSKRTPLLFSVSMCVCM